MFHKSKRRGTPPAASDLPAVICSHPVLRVNKRTLNRATRPNIEGVDPSTVRINYFKTSEADTIMMDNAITQTAQAAATGSGPFCIYSVATNNCSSFTLAGLLWGNAITSGQAKGLSYWQSTDPNALFGALSGMSLFNIDEFDLMQLQNPPPACVSTDDGLGNTSSTCY